MTSVSYPYLGLRPFDVEDAALFHGREQEIEELLKRLRDQRFIAVAGPSGIGKSSLVRAGLRSRLTENWITRVLQPGQKPMEALKAALCRDEPSEVWPLLVAPLDRDPPDLYEALQRVGSHDKRQNLLLVVDQFEELFRNSDALPEAESKDFVDLLLDSCGVNTRPRRKSGPEWNRVHVMLTLRSDYIDACNDYDGLPQALNKGLFLVPRLGPDQLRDAITKPKGVPRIDPRLVDHLISVVEPLQDQLAVLQHLLLRMYCESRGTRGSPQMLERGHFEAVGGVNAIEHQAEAIYDTLCGEEERLVEDIFRRLTEKQRGEARARRSRCSLSELCASLGKDADDGDVLRLVGLFANDQCTVLSVAEAENRVQLGHECVTSRWKRLDGWSDAEARSARTFLWLRSKVDNGDLQLSDKEFSAAEAWSRDNERRLRSAWLIRYGSNSISDPETWSREAEELISTRRREAEELISTRRREAEELVSTRRRRRWQLALAGIGLVALAVVLALANNKTEFWQAQYIVVDQQRESVSVENARLNSETNALKNHLAELQQRLALSPVATETRRSGEPEAVPRALAQLEESRAVMVKDPTLAAHLLMDVPDTTALWRRHALDVLGEPIATTVVFDANASVPPALSSDGSLLAVALKDRVVVASTRERHELTVNAELVSALALDKTTSYLAVGTEKGNVRMWDVSQSHAPKPMGDFALPEGGRVAGLDLSSERSIVAVDSTGVPWLVSVSKPTPPRALGRLGPADRAPPSFVIINASGDHAVTRSVKGQAWLWTTRGLPPSELGDDVACAQFDLGGHRLALGRNGGELEVRDLARPNEGQILTQHEGRVAAIAFDDSGDRLLSLADGVVRVSYEDGLWEPVVELTSATTVAWYPGHRSVLVGTSDGLMRASFAPLDDAQAPRPPTLLGGPPNVDWLAISRDGSVVAAEYDDSRNRHAVASWRLNQRAVPRILNSGSSLVDAGFEALGNIVTAHVNGELRRQSVDGESLQSFSALGVAHGRVAFSSGAWAVTGEDDRVTVSVADRAPWPLPDRASDLEFSGDGQRLAIVGDAGTTIWDLAESSQVGVVSEFKPSARVALNHDGSVLMGADTTSGSVSMWTWHPDGFQQSTRTPFADASHVGLSSDASRAVLVNLFGTVMVWDTATNATRVCADRGDPVRALAVAPDGSCFATATDRGEVTLWFTEPGIPTVVVQRSRRGDVRALAFAPDSQMLLAASGGGQVRLWPVGTQALASALANATGASFHASLRPK